MNTATPQRQPVQPTRHLYQGGKYVPAANTDIARTFRKARLLAVIQGKQS